MDDAKQRFLARLDELELHFSFVYDYEPPARGEQPQLRWAYTLRQRDRVVHKGHYSAGIAHAPSYQYTFGGAVTVDVHNAVQHELTTGRHVKSNKPILPEPASVMRCLLLDGSAIEHGSFEHWASEYCYDTDSRKAEAMYRACVETGLAIRAAIGDEAMRELQELSHEL